MMSSSNAFFVLILLLCASLMQVAYCSFSCAEVSTFGVAVDCWLVPALDTVVGTRVIDSRLASARSRFRCANSAAISSSVASCSGSSGVDCASERRARPFFGTWSHTSSDKKVELTTINNSKNGFAPRHDFVQPTQTTHHLIASDECACLSRNHTHIERHIGVAKRTGSQQVGRRRR